MSNENSDVTIENIALERLRQLTTPLEQPGTLMRFPLVFGRLCSVLCLNKKRAWQLLRRLEAQGHLEIVPYQGVRLAPAKARGPARPTPTGWRPTTVAQRRVLRHLKAHRRAYPSDIARALDLDIDAVIGAARRLQREGLIEA